MTFQEEEAEVMVLLEPILCSSCPQTEEPLQLRPLEDKKDFDLQTAIQLEGEEETARTLILRLSFYPLEAEEVAQAALPGEELYMVVHQEHQLHTQEAADRAMVEGQRQQEEFQDLESPQVQFLLARLRL